MTSQNSATDKVLSLAEAFAPFAVLLTVFSLGTFYLNTGNSVIVLAIILAAAVASATAFRQGRTWQDIQTAAGGKVAELFPALLILLSIGGLIGSWMLSGTIPFFVTAGLQIVSPETFAITAFLGTALMSLMTGTSWGSAGTLGVAMMGMAGVLDVSLAMTAGAVVSGAYFGDKMSPLSDTTNVAAFASGADLYSHIAHMAYTAGPSFVLALVIYTVASATGAPGDAQLPRDAMALLSDIDRHFLMGWPVFLPPVAVLGAVALRWPPIAGIGLSSLLAMAVGSLYQDFSIEQAIQAAMTGFEVTMLGEATSNSGHLASLVNRGGVYAMVDTLVIVLTAVMLTGAMETSGALKRLISFLLKVTSSIFGLISATMAAGLMLISLSSHGSVTALVVGNLFQSAYRDKGLAPENLSRSIEDSVTLTDPILPWTVSGIFMAKTLGVPTLEYLPWTVFCLGGMVFSLIYPALHMHTKGFGIKPLNRK
ncbi:Na+/H+ antiporter NhaC [Kordiimonas sp.]|uniref:Na+/H+ antiporter NhaC n=1 Tax=Kordiimonas sp. TaxID=1970157 RepID=UPI003A8D9533